MKTFIFSLQNSFNFRTRANRTEFFKFYLFYFVILGFFKLLEACFKSINFSLFNEILVLVFIIPNISLITRRLHDLGYSGWWQGILYLISIIIFIDNYYFSLIPKNILFISYPLFLTFQIFLIFKDGQNFPNKYGEYTKF